MSAPTWRVAARLLDAGDTEEGLGLLRATAQRWPDSFQTELLLAAAHALREDLPEALKALLAAQRLRPDDPRVAMGLGTIYESLGDRDSAARQYRKARAMSPTMYEAAAGLARVRHADPPPTEEELDRHARRGAPPLPPPPGDPPEVPRPADTTYDVADIAPLPLRALAGLVDLALTAAPLSLAVLDKVGVLPFGGATQVGVGGAVLALIANHLVLVPVRGQTVGKMLCRIRVVQEDGARLAWGQCLHRLIGLLVGGLLGGWGVIWCIPDPEHQGWHDQVAGTIVVRAD